MSKKIKIKVGEEARTYEVGQDVDLDAEEIRDSRGRRITREYVDRAVEDARERVGRGRPSLTGGRAHSPHVSFRVPVELRSAAEAQAAREGKRVSEVARAALEEYLARHRDAS
jgi:hypothetical protein